MASHSQIIAQELSVRDNQVSATIDLLDEGATVPFIARYRKERTGSLEDFTITQVRDRLQQLRDLDKRRESILQSIEEQGKLTDELKKRINQAGTMAQLEDLYLPYKRKRKTKATIAKEKGLEPLADAILAQNISDLTSFAQKFINTEKEVNNLEEALQGARDIVAEVMNEDLEARTMLRELFFKESIVSSKVMKGKEEAAAKYKDYFDWEEPLSKIPSHRLLAIRRGEKEMFLSVDISPSREKAISKLQRKFVSGHGETSQQVEHAIEDAFKRLMKPSLETETRLFSKKNADEEAIQVFSENLKQLLMSAPLGQKSVLAVDPGFRTGCKLVCLDRQGKLLEFQAIFPNPPQNDTLKAGETVRHLIKKYSLESVAIGNGTASRETEMFIKNLNLPSDVLVTVVSESGASVYSASEVAREEFPNEDVTVRGAVSIGRRLMDPLAELVKLDPKSIGVGQYQHDVDQTALRKSLDDVVMACVNAVGVELNTASKELLTYVSGLGPQLAENVVKYRNENGPFSKRSDLKKIPRLGEKAFEQAAGFLRIRGGKDILDRSAVHPERYNIVQQMAKDLKASVSDLMTNSELLKQLDLAQYQSGEVGMPTLKDILEELSKPGRDPRESFENFAFADGITEVSHLAVGMKLPGIVTNITKFGAFVDIGVHQDGLVHVSHLSDQFVSDPTEAVKLSQKVYITVTAVDAARKRISLSMKSDPFGQSPAKKPAGTRKKKQEVEGDMQSKLAGLRNKFNR